MRLQLLHEILGLLPYNRVLSTETPPHYLTAKSLEAEYETEHYTL
jgi:hypothetical protein